MTHEQPQGKRDASYFLIPDQPLIVLPELACAIGLAPAIVLQQIHFKLISVGREIDGERWFYNTLPQWHEVFPFWTERHLKRILKRLKDQGLIKVRYDLNHHPHDRTAWYSIDRAAVAALGPPTWAGKPPDPEQPSHSDKMTPWPTAPRGQKVLMQEDIMSRCNGTKGPHVPLDPSYIPPRDIKHARVSEEVTPRSPEEENGRPPCAVHNWMEVRSFGSLPCPHVTATLELFADIEYACDVKYYRKDADGRLHAFAHDYSLFEQRACIEHMRHDIAEGKRPEGFLNPKSLFKEDWLASRYLTAVKWWAAELAAQSEPKPCKHERERAVDGRYVCQDCGEDRGEGPDLQGMQRDIEDMFGPPLPEEGGAYAGEV